MASLLARRNRCALNQVAALGILMSLGSIRSAWASDRDHSRLPLLSMTQEGAGSVVPPDKGEKTSSAKDVLESPEPAKETAEEETTPPAKPFTLNATYYLFSDYIFRGANFSEYPKEGREDPNHQLTTTLSVDVAALLNKEPGSLGKFTFATFFEWYAGQDELDPNQGGQNLQEVDYTLSWSYEIKAIKTTITPGYNFYTYPQHTGVNTDEWFIRLDHNDAWMWKWLWPENEAGVLNPYVMYAHTVEYAAGAKWLELGFSHPFTLTETLVLTPSVVLAYQGEYYSRQFKRGPAHDSYAYTQFGLNLTYDLTKGLKLDPRWGAFTLSTFIHYNEAYQDLENADFIRDEFFGGMSIGWSF